VETIATGGLGPGFLWQLFLESRRKLLKLTETFARVVKRGGGRGTDSLRVLRGVSLPENDDLDSTDMAAGPAFSPSLSLQISLWASLCSTYSATHR
jgi:hypothetical protein